jgi:hypothetical protein
VPSWLSSDTNHAPKITALGPRRSSVEYMDVNTSSVAASPGVAAGGASSGSASGAASGHHHHHHHHHLQHADSANIGPSIASVRPRAPILIQKENSCEGDFLSSDSEHAAPKRSRQRVRHHANSTKSR